MRRIVILGGGFAGVYTAMRLSRELGRVPDVDVTLINTENYFVFQPMLPEVVSGSVQIQNIINPIRRLCPRVNLQVREIQKVDLELRVVTTSPGFRPVSHEVPFDHLVIALGTTMNYSGMPGVQHHAFPFKNLGDALAVRNHVIHALEEADVEGDTALRRALLTFVIAGGGFSGVEVAAELNDFVREVARNYRHIDAAQIQVILLHSGDLILPELDKGLGKFADKILRKRRVDIRYGAILSGATPEAALLQGGERIPTHTIIATVPSGPHPLVSRLPCKKERGRIVVDEYLRVPDFRGVWALGDCALIPDVRTGKFCPPTAQYAVREAKAAARNIAADLSSGPRTRFEFTPLGLAGALGHRSAVVQLFGWIKLSGFLGWLFWRGTYWVKLPGVERKFRVGLDWIADMILPKDIVQIKTARTGGLAHEHYENGDLVFRQGDVGDRVYSVVEGAAEAYVAENGRERVLLRIGPGECFGEMALLSDEPRRANVRAVGSLTAVSVYRRDFQLLLDHMPGMRQVFDQMMRDRLERSRTG